VVGTTEETWPSMIPKENGRYGALSFRDHESTKAATAGTDWLRPRPRVVSLLT
jgi:hypothetical protein